MINESSLANRTALIENVHKSCELEVKYQPQQHVFIKNPTASRQKLAPRYTHDAVSADLLLHIYTSKKRKLIAISRKKRVSNSTKLFQVNTTGSTLDTSSGD